MYRDTQENLNTLRSMDRISVKCNLTALIFFKHNKLYICYLDAQNMLFTENDAHAYNNSCTGTHKSILNQ